MSDSFDDTASTTTMTSGDGDSITASSTTMTSGDGDSITDVSSQSWFGRVGGALVGLVVGLVLVPGSIALLGWNEHRAVETARALSEGAGMVVDVSPDRVDPANQRRLVHVAGPLAVPGALKDPLFDVSAPGAAQLVRKAEMYQWVQSQTQETHNKLGGGTETVTTYHYAKEWSDTAHDSSRFRQPNGHGNPAPRVQDSTMVAPTGKVGAFTADAAVLRLTGPLDPVAPASAPAGGTVADGGLYFGADPGAPAVGDTRVHFTAAHPAVVSVVAQQEGAALAAYTTRNGRTLLMVEPGTVPAAAMFQQAQDDNVVMTWVLRGVGAVLMLVGFLLFMRPLSVLASVLPFLGSIVGAGSFLVALLLTLVVAPVVVALAWLAVRPLLGGGLLAAGAIAAVLLVTASRRRQMAR